MRLAGTGRAGENAPQGYGNDQAAPRYHHLAHSPVQVLYFANVAPGVQVCSDLFGICRGSHHAARPGARRRVCGLADLAMQPLGPGRV